MIKFRMLFCCLFLSVIAITCGKKGTPDIPPVTPSIKITGSVQERLATPVQMHFTVSLDRTTTVPVSVEYKVIAGTAVSPKDFTASSGTLTIEPGKSNADISVQIAGNPESIRQDNLQFTVELSNPKNANIMGGSGTAVGTIITENGSDFVTDDSGYRTPESYPGMNLVWQDEFDGTELNKDFWNYEIGNGAGGWGNNELEYYTNSPKNVFVSNGNLIIEAREETVGGFNYTSARLTTQSKKTFQYGRVDIRAKLPEGKGLWPALWMLGSNINTVSWPACGEIDIMELLGHEPFKVYSTMHYGIAGNQGSKGNSYMLPSGSFKDEFHVFSMVWEENIIRVFVDDNLEFTFQKSDAGGLNYPFNTPFFFIFNVAVGGNWPGSPDDKTKFPQRMIVDYIRVFQ